MAAAIPIIDVSAMLSGHAGALAETARQVHDALTQVGFFVITGHDVPRPLIDRTFAEAERFHALPMTCKLALKMNEHNSGYMAMDRYAVWTSDVNRNDKPDLNEAPSDRCTPCHREEQSDEAIPVKRRAPTVRALLRTGLLRRSAPRDDIPRASQSHVAQ